MSELITTSRTRPGRRWRPDLRALAAAPLCLALGACYVPPRDAARDTGGSSGAAGTTSRAGSGSAGTTGAGGTTGTPGGSAGGSAGGPGTTGTDGTSGGTGSGSTGSARPCTPSTQDTACVGAALGIYQACVNGTCAPCSGDVGPNTTCNWGDRCGSDGSCGWLGLDACPTAALAPAFTSGPLIVDIRAQGFSTSDPNTECVADASGNPSPKVEITVTFAAGPSGLTGHASQLDFISNHVLRIKTSGSTVTPAFARGYSSLANQTSGTFVVGLCGISSVSDEALILKDEAHAYGNAACYSAP